jgi:hypothetical protein
MTNRARVALLVPEKPSSWTPPLHDVLQRSYGADRYSLGPSDPFPDLCGYDIVLSRLKFRHLASRLTIDWGGCTGLKVHWDEDGFWDGLWTESPYRGLWSDNISRLGFDLLVVTGVRAQEYFRQRGIATEVVHKGYDPVAFVDRDVPRRDAIAMFGQDYRSRTLAKRALVRSGVVVEHVKAPFPRLSSTLNTYLSALICTLDVDIRGGAVGRHFARRVPSLVRGTLPGPEPMLKLFEVAASGCAPYTDFSPDLEELGFIDGVTAIVYQDIPELVEKAGHYQRRPAELRQIGVRASALVAENHTWQHRVDTLLDILQREWGQRDVDGEERRARLDRSRDTATDHLLGG